MEERNKVLSVAKTFLRYREEDLKRILSDEGILIRINRSIQAEGSSGELKQDIIFIFSLFYIFSFLIFCNSMV